MCPGRMDSGLLNKVFTGLEVLFQKTVDRCTVANILLIFFGLVLFVCSTLFDFVCQTRTSNDLRNLFFVLYEFNVRQIFQHQMNETHKILFQGVDSVLRLGASRPAALLLLAVGRGARCTALSLTRQLARVFIATVTPTQNAYVDKIKIKGHDYTTSDDFWEFHGHLMYIMNKYRIAVVTEVESLHPQVATALCHASNDSYAPRGQAVLLMVLDSGERFTQEQAFKTSASQLAETVVRECLGPFLDREIISEMVRHITWRTVVILNEPAHRPTLCPVCSHMPA